MKKSLTLLAAAAATMCASAQVEYANIDPEALGITSEAAEQVEGLVLCESASVKMSLAYTDNVKASSANSNSCTGLYINDQYYSDKGGITGSTNPQGCTLETPPASGFVFRFDATQAGYIIAGSKLSSNKNYWVWEGLPGQEPNCVAYEYGIIWDAGEGVQAYTGALPADDMGYINLAAADAEKYFTATATKQLRWIITGDDATELGGNGFGYLMFPVYAGVPYLMCAQGSKMTAYGFTFIPSGDEEDASAGRPEKIGAGSADELLYKFYGYGADGIASVAVDNVETPMYNVLGQPVDNNYKGLVIKNGRKFINK